MTQQNTTINTDTVFLRQLYFKDQLNNPIPAGQALLTRGDGGTYFGSPFSNPSSFVYGFHQFIGGSNLSTFATASQNTLWLDTGAGIQISQVSTASNATPHYYISATAPEQLIVNNSGGPTTTLNFSSLTDDLYGGRTLYYEGLGDTVISISDTTVLFESATTSSLSSLQELLSTQAGINEYTSTLVSTVNGELSTINLLFVSTGITALYSTLTTIESNSFEVSSFIYSTFFNEATGHYTKLNVDKISTNAIVTSSILTNNAYANTVQIGSTILYDATALGSNNSFCSPVVSDGTVSTFTDYFIITDNITSNTQFAIEKQFLFSRYIDPSGAVFETQGQQVQIGFIPQISTQGSSLPPTIGEQFVPILQQIQVIQNDVDCAGISTVRYTLKNTAKLDEICATGDIWLNGSTVTISSLWVSSINGLTPGSGGGGVTSSLQLSTFSTIYVSTAYLENTVASSIQISTVMGQVLPILTLDSVNNRLGVNLGATQQPRATLDVNGIVYAGNFVTTSDRRLKWNIADLEQVHTIPKAYRYRSVDAPDGDIGCMADEVEAIAPECVYTTPTGYKAIAYPKLVPLCLSLIRSLTDRVVALEKQSNNPMNE